MADRWRVANNKAAIWTGGEDTAPFDNPYGNLARLKFHSDLNYIQIIDERTFNVPLPARTNFQSAAPSYPLYAHGRGGFPFVLGSILVSGQPCAFTGSVPIQPNRDYKGGLTSGFARWISLGADATYVYLNEYCVSLYTKDVEGNVFAGSYPAITIPITVWMTNEILQ